MPGSHDQPLTTAGAVLVGGASRRLPAGKTAIEVAGIPLARRVADALAAVVDEVFVVGRAGEPNPLPGLRFVEDGGTARAALVGVAAALAAAGHPVVLVVACDLPFLRPEFLRGLVDRLVASGADACVPRRGGLPEPLAAAWRPAGALPVLSRRLAAGEYRLAAALAEIGPAWLEGDALRSLDPEGLCLMNVNDEADLARARALAEKLGR